MDTPATPTTTAATTAVPATSATARRAPGPDRRWQPLTHRFRDELPELALDWEAADVPDPRVMVLNAPLAIELGLDPDDLVAERGARLLAGLDVPDGARPVALAYAGHQFGNYSPRLGDGRALLLGEIAPRAGGEVDVHLKGSGRTPFARGGDGKAALGPMLREYLIAEAMHALGVPTTRALAVVATGESVQRERPLPGAVLARTAASHVRVGTFEYAARLDDPTVLDRLATHAIDRHHPEAADAVDQPLALLDAVVEAQAALVARWMVLGFIHGVMNTDNTTISGESIDYGPCAFMDRFDPATVYSSIDHLGRYAYRNQPGIVQWNLARLAETLLPLIDGEVDDAVGAATDVLHTFPERYRRHWEGGMAAKLGLDDAVDTDPSLFEGMLDALEADVLDLTATFRALAADLRGESHWYLEPVAGAAALAVWRERWSARLGARDRRAVAQSMDDANPVHVPRNHLVEAALEAANEGDRAPFDTLLEHVVDPYVSRGHREFEEPAPDAFSAGFRTFCGT